MTQIKKRSEQETRRIISLYKTINPKEPTIIGVHGIYPADTVSTAVPLVAINENYGIWGFDPERETDFQLKNYVFFDEIRDFGFSPVYPIELKEITSEPYTPIDETLQLPSSERIKGYILLTKGIESEIPMDSTGLVKLRTLDELNYEVFAGERRKIREVRREVFSYLKNQYESVFNGETPDNEEFRRLINLMRDMVTNKQDFDFYRNLFERSFVPRQESIRENYEKRGKRFNLEKHVRHCLKTCVASYFPEFLNPDDV